MKTKLIKQEGIGFQTINMSDYYLTLNGKIYHTNPLTLGMLTIEGKSGGTLSYKNCHEIYLNNPKFNEMDIEIEMETISEGLDESAQAQYTKVPKLDEDKCLIIKTTKTMKEKDLDYFKQNAEEDYIKTPISVLRYITELEQRLEELIKQQEQ
jgi:hypothetical protein